MKKYILDILKNKKLHLIFFIALLIRVWGINYGFPHILNMDEPSFVRSVTGLRFSLNPNRFDWPNGLFYFHFIFYTLFYYFRVLLQILNLRVFIEPVFPLVWQDPLVFYFISRLVNAFLGSLTVYPLYYASKKFLKNSSLAIFTVITFTFIPNHVYDSHLALLDTSLTFWCTVALFFIFSIVNVPSFKNYILAGFILGIAFGTKYNAIFYIPLLLLANFYSLKQKTFLDKILNFISFSSVKKFLVSGLFFIFGFIITNPFVLFNFNLFWSFKYGRGFLFQFENVGNNSTSELPLEFTKLFYTQLIQDLGVGIYIVVILGFVLYAFACFRNKITNFTLLLPLLLMLYMVTKERNPSHYFVFLYPLFSIYFVYFLYISNWFLTTRFKNTVYTKLQFYLIFLLFILNSVVSSLYTSYVFARPDTRVLAYNYLINNVDKDVLLYYYGSELDLVSFNDLNEVKLKRIDRSNVDQSKLPFILVIAEPNLTYTEVMEGERDVSRVRGNESKFLKYSELLFYTLPKSQKGPSIFIFKVNEIEQN